MRKKYIAMYNQTATLKQVESELWRNRHIGGVVFTRAPRASYTTSQHMRIPIRVVVEAGTSKTKTETETWVAETKTETEAI